MDKKGQVSIEFLFIFAILLILLAYSVKNTTFQQGSQSIETLRVQIALEEKELANTISGAISQVYSQGPGSKTTAYVKLVYLRKPDYLEKVWGVTDPVIFITYGQPLNDGNGTYVMVLNGNKTTEVILTGGNKNAFWTRALYQRDLVRDKDVWDGSSASVDFGTGATTVYGLRLNPSEIPPTIKIVVEWNPDKPDRWKFNSTAGKLLININPGG
ncbi:MAG: class III signal peptide-containing protein [Thermococcus sp.]|nr:class III signal peptide-containing protein [Thermococcus sp.]